MSQSPQIGSMFLTKRHKKDRLCGRSVVAIPSNRVNVSYIAIFEYRTKDNYTVAIPSNRVNVSYQKKTIQPKAPGRGLMSQSPQIGSMFLTNKIKKYKTLLLSRNPLKSGQCFLQLLYRIKEGDCNGENVAIPSNRVNVSYRDAKLWRTHLLCRNPLKSGQCFLPKYYLEGIEKAKTVESQSPQIGSMFLTKLRIMSI